MKFTVEYKRTVRVREYETLTIGVLHEYDTGETAYSDAYYNVMGIVDTRIDEELERLRKEQKA